MITLNKIKKFLKCCITGKSLADSKHVNAVQLDRLAKWDFPTVGNILQGTSGRAIAYIHDDCIDKNGKITGEIKFAVEFAGNIVKYHPIEELEKIQDPPVRTCRVCGCTDFDCRQCIEKTGVPCHWVDDDLCSACI